MTESRITRLEEQIAHQNLLLEELNEVVTRQQNEIAALVHKVDLLMQRAADAEANTPGSIPLADQRPPHW